MACRAAITAVPGTWRVCTTAGVRALRRFRETGFLDRSTRGRCVMRDRDGLTRIADGSAGRSERWDRARHASDAAPGWAVGVRATDARHAGRGRSYIECWPIRSRALEPDR